MARRPRAHYERDTASIASGPTFEGTLPRLTINPLEDLSAVRSPLIAVEDRRVFQPDRLVARSTRRWNTKLVLAKPKASRRSSRATRGLQFQFKAPQHVMICVRRHRRREVLHALRKVGKGSGKRFRRRSVYSDVRC